jgi:hypothetical protein
MLKGNAFYEQLNKIANEGLDETQEEMNPDPSPVITSEEVDAAKAEEVAAQEAEQAGVQPEEEAAVAQAVQEEANQAAAQVSAEAQEQAAIQSAAENIVAQESTPAVPAEPVIGVPVDSTQVVAEQPVAPTEAVPVAAEPVAPAIPSDVPPEIAQQLPEYGALAKLTELASSNEVPPSVQQEATERLVMAMTDFENYVEVIEKTSNELFTQEANLADLNSPAGIQFVVEKLSSFVDSYEIEKTADDTGESFSGKVVKSVSNFVDSMKNLGAIKTELEKAQSTFNTVTQEADQLVRNTVGNPGEVKDLIAKQTAASELVNELQDKKRLGQAGVIGGLALAGAGAYAGGKKIYDTLQNRQEQLNEEMPSDTLEAGNQNKITGGTERMANTKSLVKDFLKVAGAAGLISIANNEEAAIELRKEASDRFDAIANMGRSEMDANLVKVAQEIYSEDELTAIVSGQHTGLLLDKVAHVLAFNEMSASELEKVADAGSVAAKGVAGALTDAASNIQATIKEDKKSTEAEGREYVGDTDKSGKVGGQLVGGTEGYAVINNPGKYNVDKTASEIVEEAVMMKQAAVKTFNEAQAVIDQYTK